MTEPTAHDSSKPAEPKGAVPVVRQPMRKVSRTGPLIGSLVAAAAPPRKVSTAELSTRVSPLGSLLGVKARLGLGFEGDQKP